MNDSRNLAIGVLTITATVLLAALLVCQFLAPAPALAVGQIDRGGDYVMVTGQFSESTELVYLTDAAAQRLNAYSYEPSTRQIVLWDSIDLARMSRGIQP